MSVYTKLTDIADSFRMYTGKTAKLSLTTMVSAIDDVYMKGRTDGENSKLFEVHKITVASDLTSGSHTLLEYNAFIQEHCKKDGFSIQVISLQKHTTGPAFGYSYNGNRHYVESGGSAYSGLAICLTANGSVTTRSMAGYCYNPSYSGIPYVENTGDVLIKPNSSNATLKAGDYLIILSVAEV